MTTERETLKAIYARLIKTKNDVVWSCLDEVLYGSLAGVVSHREGETLVESFISMIPKELRNQFDAEFRKEKADNLRAEADKIERGVE